MTDPTPSPDSGTETRVDRSWRLAGRGALLIAFLISLVTPFLPLDTDPWYHLRHGRFLFATGHLPDSTQFSYLEPTRAFVDYYWLFQVVAYGAFEAAGYWGLIAVRCAAWLALLWAIDRLVRGKGAAGPLAALLPALVAGVLIDRCLAFRPHIFSYLLLTLVLVALEERWRAPVLCALGVLWCNVHGVAYPVLWAILGAHGLDVMFDLWQKRLDRSLALRRLAILALTALSPLATPHGWRLLPVPFRSLEDAGNIILELRPFAFENLFRFDLLHMAAVHSLAVFSWLLAIFLAARFLAARSIFAVRPSRLVLLLAAVYLLCKADRLKVEMMLLCLPIWSDLLAARLPSMGRDLRRVVACGAGLLLIAQVHSLEAKARIGIRNSHPFANEEAMPHGVARFLVAEGPGGRLMQQANYGGYFLWHLEERYLIHMDMEMPFAFLPEDFYDLEHALAETAALSNMLRRYELDFVCVEPSRLPGFGDRLAASGRNFVPLFADDLMVLWGDRDRHPQLAARWQLVALDAERAVLDDAYLPEDLATARLELARLAAVDGEVHFVHRMLARIALASGDYDAAVAEAEILVELAPRDAASYSLLGDGLMAARRGEEGIEAFRRALELATEDQERQILARLAYAEAVLGKSRQAFEHLRQLAGGQALKANLKDLRLLERLAIELGELEYAERIRASLAMRAGESDAAGNDEPVRPSSPSSGGRDAFSPAEQGPSE